LDEFKIVELSPSFQVGAQTGHNVTLVDISQDVLDKSQARIDKSVRQVAKRMFKEDPAKGDKFVGDAMARLKVTSRI
jgi:3-hydroxyacyl-CoA dehydrogenase